MKDIFDRHEPGSEGGREQRRPSSAPSSPQVEEPLSRTVIDDSLLALSRELSGLKQTRVPQSAKERGWASLQRELERRPVRVAVAAGAKGSAGRSRGRRKGLMGWALGGAAATVAVVATLIATLGGGPVTVVEIPTTVTSVVSTDTSLPNTTLSTTVSTEGSSSTVVTEPTTTQSTTQTPTTGSTPGTSGTTHTTSRPTTTQPTSSPTTSGQQQNAAQQRIGSAEDAAATLAQMIVSGNMSGAGSLVASSAQSAFAWMVRQFTEPYGYTVGTGEMISSYVVQVPLAVNDREVNGQGEVITKVERFLIQVRVKGDSAAIIAIGADR